MSYLGRSYRRIIVPLKSRIKLPDMIQLCHDYGGTFAGEDFKKGIVAYFDLPDKDTGRRFQADIHRLYGAWLNVGVRSYTDWQYED